MDAVSHLSAEAQSALHLSKEERIEHVLMERFIFHRRVQKIVDHCCFLALQPQQTRAWGVGVVAISGSGKTMLAKVVAKRLGKLVSARASGGKSMMPVITVSMTGVKEARALDTRILEALGDPVKRTGLRNSDREALTMRLMREANVRLLIVDEIQDVLTATPRQRRFALDHVKLIMNSVNIPVLVLGIPGAEQAMQEDPHLSQRFDWDALPVWKCNNETRELLNALERELPLRKASNLSSVGLTKLIVKKSNGTLARLVRLVSHAGAFAIESGSECITEEVLEEAACGVPASSLLAAVVKRLGAEASP